MTGAKKYLGRFRWSDNTTVFFESQASFIK